MGIWEDRRRTTQVRYQGVTERPIRNILNRHGDRPGTDPCRLTWLATTHESLQETNSWHVIS